MSKTETETETTMMQTETSTANHIPMPLDRWFIEVVVLSLFPTIIVMIFQFLLYQKIDFLSLFNSGDLLLSAFIISTSSILHLYWNKRTEKLQKVIFYLSLACSSFCLIIYSGIKIGKTPQTHIAIFSIVFILCAFISSYAAER